METLLKRFDQLADVQDGTRALVWLERAAFGFLVLMVLSAPHSIAATQIAWLTGMLVWGISVALRSGSAEPPRARHPRALSVALLSFFAWSVLTALTSYAPDISINKLRGVAVFLIFYFVVYNVRNRRAAHLLAFLLIGSCMVNVLWMPIQRLIGRGVEIHGLAPDGPLTKALLANGDTLLEANGRKLRSPEDVLAAIEQTDTTKIKFYRPDFEYTVEVRRGDLMDGGDAMARLGISSWKKSRNWRSSGFYGHYTTYAEVLQLIASLVFGLLVGLLSRRLDPGTQRHGDRGHNGSSRLGVWASPRRSLFPLLFFCLVAMSFALLLTVTRASQLAFMISAAIIVLVGLGRKWFMIASAIALPIALGGLLFLQQSRQVGFFDPSDESIKWRQTVWQEGFDLWTSSPRNFFLGVGMDSIKRYADEWRLFDDGRLNMGHFHSTPLNLVVERGLPALLLWLIVLGVYARTLWRPLRNPQSTIRDPLSRGLLLGCLGGTVGFFSSGLVHYNLGDQEVAMVFFLLMGLGVRAVSSSSDSGKLQVES